jgi:hypothetical protein
MSTFIFNQQQHPQDKFWTSFGLARGYTALGDNRQLGDCPAECPRQPEQQDRSIRGCLKKLKKAS